jgi:hypothetical protein
MYSHFEGFFIGVLNCDTHNWFFFSPSKSLFQCFEGIQSVKPKIRLLGPLKVYNYIKTSDLHLHLGSTHHLLIEKEAKDHRIPIIQLSDSL